MQGDDFLGFKTIKRNMGIWMKKITHDTDLDINKNNIHCNNFATRCCITCNRCWDKKYQSQSDKKSK